MYFNVLSFKSADELSGYVRGKIEQEQMGRLNDYTFLGFTSDKLFPAPHVSNFQKITATAHRMQEKVEDIVTLVVNDQSAFDNVDFTSYKNLMQWGHVNEENEENEFILLGQMKTIAPRITILACGANFCEFHRYKEGFTSTEYLFSPLLIPEFKKIRRNVKAYAHEEDTIHEYSMHLTLRKFKSINELRRSLRASQHFNGGFTYDEKFYFIGYASSAEELFPRPEEECFRGLDSNKYGVLEDVDEIIEAILNTQQDIRKINFNAYKNIMCRGMLGDEQWEYDTNDEEY